MEARPATPPAPDRFWAILAQTLGAEDDPAARCEALRAALSPLAPEELFAFDCDYRRMLARANHWDLWAAAYVINGGASDDGFDYFKDWLISRGETVFEAALADPETLVGAGTPFEAENEGFRYVVQEVHEAKTGQPLPLSDLAPSHEPAGEEFDEETVDEKFPKLAAWASEHD